MGAAGFHEGDGPLHKPPAMHVRPVQAKKNRGRIHGHLCVALHNAFERERIVVNQSLSHPIIGRGKAAIVQRILVCQRFHHSPVFKRIPRLDLIFERVLLGIPFDFGLFSL